LIERRSVLAEAESSGWKATLAGVVTVAVLAVFFVGIAYMAVQAGPGTADDQWERWVYLLTGVEAVTFAAVGWLFGKEVNRQRAENAEERAKDSEKDASNGKALAALSIAKEHPQGGEFDLQSLPPEHGLVVSKRDLAEITTAARVLFPNLNH
jgi:hypothetical protein